MRKKQFYLVTDATAEKVEEQTGRFGRDTPFGVLVEKPAHDDIESAMSAIRRAFNPPPCACRGVLHRPDCPIALLLS